MKAATVWRAFLARQVSFLYVLVFLLGGACFLWSGHETGFVVAMVVLSAIGLALSLFDKARLDRLKAEERFENTGEILRWYAPTLTPALSMIKACERAGGLPPGAIKDMLIQTCDLGSDYFERFKNTMDETGAAPSHIEFVGVGADEDADVVRKHFPKAQVFMAKEKLTRHFNVIRGADRTLIWYEPEHNPENRQDFEPQDGAFLILVDQGKESEVLARFNRDKGRLLRG